MEGNWKWTNSRWRKTHGKALELSTSAHQKKIYRDITHYKLHDIRFDYRGIAHSDTGLGAKDLRESQHGAFNNIRKIAALQDKVDAIMADHYQDSDNKKASDNGGRVVVTGKEFGEYKDIKELRKKAKEYYKKNL